MKKTIPLTSVIAILFFTACSRYQYVTITSNDIKTNDKMEFVVDNDSLRLQYSFYGENAPVNITFQNKLNVPMYIDWQRSALIIEDKAISYVPNEVPIQGSINGSTSNYSYNRHVSYGAASGSINATANLPEHIAFIPPNSYVTKLPMGVTNQFLQNIPDSAWHKQHLQDPTGLTVNVKRAFFNEATTPLRFKSYLTVMVGGEQVKPTVFEHTFYVNELLMANEGPEFVWFNKGGRGNQYYVKEYSGAGAAATGFMVIAGVATITALSQSVNNGGGAGK